MRNARPVAVSEFRNSVKETLNGLSAILSVRNATDSIRARMAHGVAWTTMGTASNQGSTLIVNVLLAHLLPQHAFGQYAVLQTTSAVVTALAQVATGYTATKYLAEYRERDPPRAGRILELCWTLAMVMGVAAMSALFIGAEHLADALAAPGLESSVRLVAAIVLFNVLNGFLIGALAGLESYRAAGKAGIMSGGLYVGLCAIGAAVSGLNGALAGSAWSAAIQCAILWRILRKSARDHGVIARRWSVWHEREILLRFSIPAALTGLVSLPAIWMASAFLARVPGGFNQLAFFSAANSFRTVVLFLPNIVNTVGMSLLNNRLGAGAENQFRRLFWYNLAGIGTMVLIGAAGVAVTGRWLLAVFGVEFSAAYPVLLILMIAALAEALSIGVYQAIQTRGRLWISLFGVALPSSAALAGLAAWLAPSAGAIGLAWAYVGWWSVNLTCGCLIVARTGVWRQADTSSLVRA